MTNERKELTPQEENALLITAKIIEVFSEYTHIVISEPLDDLKENNEQYLHKLHAVMHCTLSQLFYIDKTINLKSILRKHPNNERVVSIIDRLCAIRNIHDLLFNDCICPIGEADVFQCALKLKKEYYEKRNTMKNCENCLKQLNVLIEGFIYWLKWVEEKTDNDNITPPQVIQMAMTLQITKSMIIMLKDNNDAYQQAVKDHDIENPDVKYFIELLEIVNGFIDHFDKHVGSNPLAKQLINKLF